MFYFALGMKSHWNRLYRYTGPASILVVTCLPNSAPKTVKIAVTVVMIGMADYYVYTQLRIEDKLQTCDLLAAVSVGAGMGRGAVAYSSARRMIYIYC